MLLKSDIINSSKCKKNDNNDQIKGLLDRNTFAFVNNRKLYAEANFLWERFIPEMKQTGTDNEQYKSRFIVQGHTEKPPHNLHIWVQNGCQPHMRKKILAHR